MMMKIEEGDLIQENISDEGFYLIVITKKVGNLAEGYIIDSLFENLDGSIDRTFNKPIKIPEEMDDIIDLSYCILIEKDYLKVRSKRT